MTQTNYSQHRILTVQQPASSSRSSPPEHQLRKASNILSLTGRTRRNLTYSQWKARSNNMTSTDNNYNLLGFLLSKHSSPPASLLTLWLEITSHKQMVTAIRVRNAFPDVHYFLPASLKLNPCLYNTEHLLLNIQYPQGKSNLNGRSL